MDEILLKNGFYRLSKLLMEIINTKEKEVLIKLSNSFLDGAGEFIAALYVENNINQEDVEKHNKELNDIEEVAMTELNDGKHQTELTSI